MANLIRVIVTNIFNFAIENNFIINNPCTYIKLPKSILKEKSERQILTIEQQKLFIEFSERKKYRYIAICKLMLYTGIRINEALSLTWDDVDFKSKKISINKTFAYTRKLNSNENYSIQTPKSKTSKREIPLCNSALELLLAQKNNNTNTKWVFSTRNNTAIRDTTFRKSLRNLIKILNDEEKECAIKENRNPILFPNITPHSFRHTFATRCFENGVNGKIVQKYLGHSSMSMTMDLYTHVDEKLMVENIEKIDNLF